MAGWMARQYGVNFASYEREGKMTTWYGGKAFRRVHAIVAIQPGRTKADLRSAFASLLTPTSDADRASTAPGWNAGDAC